MEPCSDRSSDTYLGILLAAASRTVPSWRRPECTDTARRAFRAARARERTPSSAPFGREAVRLRGCVRLRLRSALQGTGFTAYVSPALAHGACLRPWQVRVDKPCGLRVRKPRLLGSITIRQSDEHSALSVQAKDSTPDLRQLQVKSGNHGRDRRARTIATP